MKEDIKIPIIVKISFGLVITEVVLAISWSLFAVIYNYGEVKWSGLAGFSTIGIILHILLACVAYGAVVKRKKKDSMAIGFLMLVFSLIFFALLVGNLTVEGILTFVIPISFCCSNGIIFMYWAKQIRESSINSAISSDDQNIEYNKEIKKKSKYNKISLGLLVISLVMAFITQNPPLVLSSLLGLGLFFIIQFRVARCFLYIIFTISLSLLIKLLVKHQFFSPEDYINLLWSLSLAIGLFIAFYSFCRKGKSKADKVILWAAIIFSIVFNCFTNSSSPNYVTEIEMVRQEKSFVPSKNVFEISQKETKSGDVAKNNENHNKSIKSNYKGWYLYYCGHNKFKHGKYEEAIKDFDNVLKVNTVLPFVWYYRGKSKFKLNQYQKAILDYDKAIKRNPEYIPIYSDRAVAYAKLGQYKKAIKDYDTMIRFKPKIACRYGTRAYYKFMLKQYEEAIKDYSKAIELDPEYVAAYVNRGHAKNRLKQDKEAIKDYDKAIKLNPNFITAYLYRGLSKDRLKQHKEAVEDYNTIIKLNPKQTAAYIVRGNSKFELKQYKEAIKDFNKALELVPKLPSGYYNLGYSKLKLKQYKDARKDFLKAKELAEEQKNIKALKAVEKRIKELDEAEKKAKK